MRKSRFWICAFFILTGYGSFPAKVSKITLEDVFMPKTKFQKVIFGSMMAFVMVYGMEVYNTSLIHGGLSNSVFGMPVGELLMLGVIVFILEKVIGGPLARKLAFKLVDPEKDRPIVIILAISIMTVCCMCPMMSLVATILYKGVDSEIVAKWIQTTAVNFPMALCWQIFIAGPLVRLLFGKLFNETTCKINPVLIVPSPK